MRKEFLKWEVAKELLLSADTILFYAKTGVVEPEHNPKGRGKRRKYSRRNLVEFQIVRLLQQHGLMKLEDIKAVLEVARKKHGGRYINPDDEFWASTRGDKGHGPFIIVTDLHKGGKPKVEVGVHARVEGGDYEMKLIINLDLIFAKVNSIE